MRIGIALATGLAIALLALSPPARAEDLPAPTKKYLAMLKLDPSILAGLDQELKLPAGWLDGAKKEPAAQILGTWTPQEWRDMTQALKLRYPEVKLDYTRSSRDNRQVQMLVAYKQGRRLADVISSFSSVYEDLMALHGLVDLRDLPNFKNIAPGAYAKDGSWIGERNTYWCMAYNTDLVKKQDLPKEWEDLITNPFWKGKLALSNAPAGWLPAIWRAKGEDYGRRFLTRIFTEVKPIRRNEGRDATAQLTAAGEQAASVPSSDYRAKEFSDRGAPIGFHCPSIVPAAPAQLGLLAGGKSEHNAKIFLNWLLSKEGQISMHAVVSEVPVHKDFQTAAFLPYPDEVLDKSKTIIEDDFDMKLLDRIQKLWTLGWDNELK
jgi:iron(III) transport system substrate-binding protein